MKHQTKSLSSEDKISLAYHLQAKYGQTLIRDKKIQDLLVQLNKKIDATWKEMSFIGVVMECIKRKINQLKGPIKYNDQLV